MRKVTTFYILALFILDNILPEQIWASPETKHGYMPADTNLIEFDSSDTNFTDKLNALYKDMLKGKLNGENNNNVVVTDNQGLSTAGRIKITAGRKKR